MSLFLLERTQSKLHVLFLLAESLPPFPSSEFFGECLGEALEKDGLPFEVWLGCYWPSSVLHAPLERKRSHAVL